MSLTQAQLEAVRARGNVLVVAGAGTGKTRTLVERCLGCLVEERPRVSIDELLLVTFTEAAAAEMRQRIRARLEEELARHPSDQHWQEQLALFETAHIGTLHSFCLQLVRQHFFELELDPQLAVLAEAEARLLAEETLESLLQKAYAGDGPDAESIQQLIQIQGRGWDKPVRTLVFKLHQYAQTVPDPAAWLRRQLEAFASPVPAAWLPWCLEGVAAWRARWLPSLQAAPPGNQVASSCAAALQQLPEHPGRVAAAACLAAVTAAATDFPDGKKGAWVDPFKRFFEETAFLGSLATVSGGTDPLAEDWDWVRGQMGALLRLAGRFREEFSSAKRELGVVDFQDLEQHALRLLWDLEAGQPTEIARHWRDQLRFVFVDEYQDINAAQDKIIEALSRDGPRSNRFLVGDIKQSIYRFRLANPRIFQNYVETWSAGAGVAIPLVENFRSREGLLDFVNSLFESLMRREFGGVPYDERARLRFGAASERQPLSAANSPARPVELHLRLNGSRANGATEENDGLAAVRELEEADKEARLVALRLRELKLRAEPVWDEPARAFRPADWRDMAVLLRSPANKAECYAKEFARLNIPLQVARAGFYQSLEISDLLSLLQLLDNPLQDLPALAVLRSPLVGLTANELAEIRLAAPKTRFWTALLRWQELVAAGSAAPAVANGNAAHEKVGTFLERFHRWRGLARQVSLSRCLESVLTETHYPEWLLTQARGEQRHANVRRLQTLAGEFDQFQRQGLFRFLRFVEAQRLAETEPEVAAAPEQNAVRLMSIHQSKGLEFPIVVVADLGKAFNRADLRDEIILDERYGLCPQIQPPHTGKRYPSLPYWLARQRQNQELLGEELRLLYVAVTRARDRLLLSATVSQTRFEHLWAESREITPELLLGAGSYSDWLGIWFASHTSTPGPHERHGQNAWLDWTLHEDAELAAGMDQAESAESAAAPDFNPSADELLALQRRLAWEYPCLPATRQPAKTSVSLLRRRAAEALDEETVQLGPDVPQADHSPASRPPGRGSSGRPGNARSGAARPGGKVAPLATAVAVGTAHHRFLELVDLAAVATADALRQHAERLQREHLLEPEQAALLDFAGLEAFWTSGLGARIRRHAECVHRELAFTFRCSPAELATLTGLPSEPTLADEFVIVQGVADLVVILPAEIWLLDFKTDSLGQESLPERARLYEPQIRIYAQALAQIYNRPVTESWLWFLSQRQAVAVASPSGLQLD